MKRLSSCLLVVSMLVPSTLFAVQIGLYAATDCTSCNLVLGPTEWTGTFVVAVTDVVSDPYTCGGVQGAALRITGLPANWIVTVTPNPAANVAIGSLFGDGAAIAFPQAIREDCVHLYAVTVIPNPPGSEARLRVEPYLPLIWPGLECPLVSPDCFEPFPMCAEGGVLAVNSSTDCIVGVASRTWTQVRVLYRDPGRSR